MSSRLSISDLVTFTTESFESGINATVLVDGNPVGLAVSTKDNAITMLWNGETEEQRASNQKQFEEYIDALPPLSVSSSALWRELCPTGFLKMSASQHVWEAIELHMAIQENEQMLRERWLRDVIFILDGNQREFFTTPHNGQIEKTKNRVTEQYAKTGKKVTFIALPSMTQIDDLKTSKRENLRHKIKSPSMGM